MRSRSTSPTHVERLPSKQLQPTGGLSNIAKVLLLVAVLLAYPLCFFWSLFLVYDELPASQNGVAGEASGGSSLRSDASCDGVVVFGHRASQPSTVNSPTPTSAPGSVAAVGWLAEKGICAYDVDCFETADGALVVGHPTEIAQRLHLPASSPADALRLADLKKADGNQTATVSEFLAAYSATSCMARHNFFRGGHSKDSGKGAAQKDATELRLLIEPKGKAATVATLDYLAQQVRAYKLPPRIVGVWVFSESLAQHATSTGVLTPLLAVKGNTSPLPSAAETVAFGALGPPVQHVQLSQAVSEASRAQGQKLFTWVVDNVAQLATARDANADGVISNDPVAIQEALCREANQMSPNL